jgi:hypothetical protein
MDPERARTNIANLHFDTARLRRALASSGLACPPIDRRLIGTYADAMAGREGTALAGPLDG